MTRLLPKLPAQREAEAKAAGKLVTFNRWTIVFQGKGSKHRQTWHENNFSDNPRDAIDRLLRDFSRDSFDDFDYPKITVQKHIGIGFEPIPFWEQGTRFERIDTGGDYMKPVGKKITVSI